MLTRLPLGVDVHFHARDLTQSHKGTIETETLSALMGGWGGCLFMPNTDPPIINFEMLNQYMDLARNHSYCNYGFNLGTRGDDLDELSRCYGYVKALKLYLDPTTGNLLLQDWDKIEAIFERWHSYRDKPIIVHAEDAEKIARLIRLAEVYECRLHVAHVSLAEQLEQVRKAQMRGLPVTAEACPHHLIFTQEDEERLGGYGKMKPPLETKNDQHQLWEGLADGTIGIIATDHAPHTVEEKTSESPPFGVIGEPTFSVMWKAFHERNLRVEKLTQMMCDNPAKIFKLSVPIDSWMDVNLDEEFEVGTPYSKAGYSPYVNQVARGRIVEIVLHGPKEVEHGKPLGIKAGRLL